MTAGSAGAVEGVRTLGTSRRLADLLVRADGMRLCSRSLKSHASAYAHTAWISFPRSATALSPRRVLPGSDVAALVAQKGTKGLSMIDL